MRAAQPLPTNSNRSAGRRRRDFDTPNGNARAVAGLAVAGADSVRLAIKMRDFTWVSPETPANTKNRDRREPRAGPYGQGGPPSPSRVAALELSRQLIAEMARVQGYGLRAREFARY